MYQILKITGILRIGKSSPGKLILSSWHAQDILLIISHDNGPDDALYGFFGTLLDMKYQLYTNDNVSINSTGVDFDLNTR